MSREGIPLIEAAAAFLGANLVFARFEKVARASVARGTMQGLFRMDRELNRSREGALKDVPAEVRTRIRREIDDALATAGLTRTSARQAIAEVERVRVIGRSTVEELQRLWPD